MTLISDRLKKRVLQSLHAMEEKKKEAHVLYLLCFKGHGIILLSGYFYVKEKGWHVCDIYMCIYKRYKKRLKKLQIIIGI